MKYRKALFRCLLVVMVILIIYGLGRLYFHLTAGFTLSNIASDFTHQPQWEVRPLSTQEKEELNMALNQPYRYLGKGCQSYVFLSRDGRFVIKFFKYQRFRMQPWLAYFPPLPALVKYRKEKKEKKWEKLNSFVQSWKVAFENLKNETGLIFVHLNKTKELAAKLTIFDKLGIQHQIDLDQTEFCIQKRAEMLCDVILQYRKDNELEKAQNLIDRLFELILSEYSRGLADNDHALMQNTGVVNGLPIHIDVGQFVINEKVKNPQVYRQELFTKMYKFKLWLFENYPELADYLDLKLHALIGSDYPRMHPVWRNKK